MPDLCRRGFDSRAHSLEQRFQIGKPEEGRTRKPINDIFAFTLGHFTMIANCDKALFL